MSFSLRNDPLAAFRFRVEIDEITAPRGMIEAGFTDCSGLHAETDTVEYREGGRNGTVLRFRGQTHFAPLVLRRGLATSSAFWDWYVAVMAGAVQRRNGAIILLDASGVPALAWDIRGAYPVKWSGPELRAEAGAVAIESIELAHQGFSMSAAL
jgi:phage tail-like protein